MGWETAVSASPDAVLPEGVVSVLLADGESSSRAWEDRPDEMPEVVVSFDETIDSLVAEHRGVRPVEQGEGDSFVAAFSRPGDAVRCAVAVQQALASTPLRMRMAIHTGEVLRRDPGIYMGRTMN